MIGQIYMISNKTTSMSYIGQTKSFRWDYNRWKPHGFEGRWKEHLTMAAGNPKYCTTLCKAIRDYRKTDFNIKLLYECKIEDLNFYEVEFIKTHNTVHPHGFNMSSVDGTAISDETRKRMSESAKARWKTTDVAQQLSNYTSNKKDLEKIAKVKLYIDHIEICKINTVINTKKKIGFNTITLRFYNALNKRVIVSSKENKIAFTGFHQSIDDCLLRIIEFFSHFKPLKIIFLNEELEAKYNAIMQNTSSNVE